MSLSPSIVRSLVTHSTRLCNVVSQQLLQRAIGFFALPRQRRASTLVLDGETLSCDALCSAAHPRVSITVKDGRWPKIERCRELVDEWAQKEEVIYGVNTSCGGLVDHLLPHESDHEFQENLVRAVSTQVGEPFPDEVVRMTMVARANSLCRGYSGIKRCNLEILLRMINQGVSPIIPQQGSLGTSGDLGPLGCIACVAIGEWKARYDGRVMPGKEAMAAAGIPLMHLNAKEDLSLINGTSCMSALAALSVLRAKNLVFNQDVISTLSYEALLARKDPFNVTVHEKKYHPGQYATAQNLQLLLQDSKLCISDTALSAQLKEKIANQHDVVVADIPMEDAYSIRCSPQYIGPIRDAVDFANRIVVRELNSSNDNPLIFTESSSFFHNGHFHGQYLSTAMDVIAMTCANVAVIADRRVDRMMVKAHSVGLSPFLAVGKEGVNMGLMGGQFMTASMVAENRTMVTPASCQSVSTTDAFQDVVSFGLIAGRKALKVIENSEYALAHEALCAAQAVEMRGVHELSRAGRALHAAIREVAPFQAGGNVVYMDHLEALRQRIRGGDLVQRVTNVVGPLTWIDEHPERAKLPVDGA